MKFFWKNKNKRNQCSLTILILTVVPSLVAAVTQNYTSGSGVSCVDATCSQTFEMKSLIPGWDQYEAICQQLWAKAAYVFPNDAYSYGSEDGKCYYHHTYAPSSHIAFGSWENIAIPDPKNNGKSCPSPGNPINPAVGNKFQVETDIPRTQASHIQFVRTYNSQTAIHSSLIGAGWRTSYDKSLSAIIINGDVKPDSLLTAEREDGKIFFFTYRNGQFDTSTDINDQLSRLIDESGQLNGFSYFVMSTGDTEVYNLKGKLQSITSSTGITQIITRNSLGQIETVRDSFGYQLGFNYNSLGLIEGITAPDGALYQYNYDSEHNLISVTYPGGKSRVYHYNEASFTNGATMPHLLTGITNESGSRFATFRYDSHGRAISTEHAGGMERFTIDYSLLDDANEPSVTVINPLGKKTKYELTLINGVSKVLFVEGVASENCAAANQYISYYSNGTLQTQTDWEGSVTLFERDTHGRITQKNDALKWPTAPQYGLNVDVSILEATAKTKTIETCWHTIHNKPERTIEPKRVILYEYFDNGQLKNKSIEKRTKENEVCP